VRSLLLRLAAGKYSPLALPCKESAGKRTNEFVAMIVCHGRKKFLERW
jgi:hypothetical protein